MTMLEAVKLLKSKTCDCGSVKAEGHVFCRNCYMSLSPTLRTALYQKMGNGFEGAVDIAREALGFKGGAER